MHCSACNSTIEQSPFIIPVYIEFLQKKQKFDWLIL